MTGIEDVLVARLATRVPPPARVFTAADLDGVNQAAQFTPALHIVFDGYTPTRDTGDGRVQELELRWLVVAAVRNAREARTGGPARADAVALIATALTALLGFRPAPDHSALRLATAPPPGFSAGYHYLPLAFTCRTTRRGDPD